MLRDTYSRYRKEQQMAMTEDELRKEYRKVLAMGISMVAAIIIYAVSSESIKAQYAPFDGFVKPPPPMEILRPVLLVVSAAMFFAIRFIRKAILSADPDRFAKRKVLNRSGSYQGEIGQFVAMSVVVYALCESVAIYGLVLFLIAGSSFDFYLFMALSLVYFGIFFPRFYELKEWYRRRGQKDPERRETVFE